MEVNLEWRLLWMSWSALLSIVAFARLDFEGKVEKRDFNWFQRRYASLFVNYR